MCDATTTTKTTPTEPMTIIQLPGIAAHPEDLTERLQNALAAQPEGYQPRTHHFLPGGAPRYINRLILETSPYLLQHAHNPVNWYPWSEEAFRTAAALDRPILLSVGYSTCHWCHVMERESFEDEEIAAFINANFIAIKVDREERPDVDGVYMTAVQLMTGGGGWPMTVVMTADKRPFFGGTYFPARDGDRGARIGFLTILRRLVEAYANDKARIAETAARLSEAILKTNEHARREGVPGPEALATAAVALANRYDGVHGGFGRAPKFPRPSTYGLLLRYWRRTNDAAALKIVTHSLTKMKDGGIYDHVGGGFARYSTDERWLVPHFEKMLYDNAQLAVAYTELYQATGDAEAARVARDVLDYVLHEMTGDEGGFYSATDADSEGEEGKFFVWTPAELEEVLGHDRARAVSAYYGVTARGNFEGHNILNVTRSHEEVAAELELTPDELKSVLETSRKMLYDAREKRVHPLLDDKVLTEWNGQMIGAFARAGLALDEPRYVDAAKRAADFVLAVLVVDDRVLRAYRAKKARHLGVLEDYAFFVAALIDVFEATGETKYLERALALQSRQNDLFADDADGAYFTTADDGEALLVREKPIYDGAQPAGNSVAAMNLLRLAELTGDHAHTKRAESIFRTFGESLERGAMECPQLAQALDFHLDRTKQIVIVESEAGTGAALLDTVRTAYQPNRVLVRVVEEDVAEMAKTIPLLEGKRVMGDARATAYVCFQQTCKKPTSDPKELADQVAEITPIEAAKLQLR
jgi:uncharacterized protein YyaL (SSP411 family)